MYEMDQGILICKSISLSTNKSALNICSMDTVAPSSDKQMKVAKTVLTAEDSPCIKTLAYSGSVNPSHTTALESYPRPQCNVSKTSSSNFAYEPENLKLHTYIPWPSFLSCVPDSRMTGSLEPRRFPMNHCSLWPKPGSWKQRALQRPNFGGREREEARHVAQ